MIDLIATIHSSRVSSIVHRTRMQTGKEKKQRKFANPPLELCIVAIKLISQPIALIPAHDLAARSG